MKNTCLLCIALLGCFFQPLNAQTPIIFTDALAQGVISVEVKGLGGHTGQCISIHFQRLKDKPLKIKIPAGHIFEAADSTTQNIISVKEEVFTLTAKKQFIRMQGFCAESGDSGPSSEESFQLGKMAVGNLLKMAQFIADKKLWNESDAQYAIWCMSDSLRVESLSHPGLLNMACQLLGQPLPAYKINYPKIASTTPAPRQPNQPRPRRQPVFEKKPLSVEGVFQYEAEQDTKISVYVENAAGEKVKAIFEQQPQQAGVRGKYTFSFRTNKLPPGNYEVVLYAGEVAVKKIKVFY